MNPPKPDPESAAGLAPGPDPELEAALKRVLEVIYKDHPLNPNQILVLSSELQRIGVHRLVEEHLRKYRYRQEAIDSEPS
ncbi:MAG: hypothetical protein WBG49_13870 [Thermoanaerobaculia bacterium]